MSYKTAECHKLWIEVTLPPLAVHCKNISTTGARKVSFVKKLLQ
jgi:hypothetical protein